MGPVESLPHARRRTVYSSHMLLRSAEQPIDRIDNNRPVLMSTSGQGIKPLFDHRPMGQVGRAITLHMRGAIFRVDNESAGTCAKRGFADARWAIHNPFRRSQVDLVQYGRWEWHNSSFRFIRLVG